MDKNHLVILTVPHAKCHRGSPRMEHTCDYSAETFARALEISLVGKGMKTVLYVGNINRRYGACDLNRSSCRGKDFRRDLSRQLDERGNKKLFVVDCHSFPPTYGPWSAHEIVFLTFSSQPLVNRPSQYIHKALVDNGVKSGLNEGSYANDIILESLEKGVRAILAEINEYTEIKEPKRLKFITNVMSDKIKELMLS